MLQALRPDGRPPARSSSPPGWGREGLPRPRGAGREQRPRPPPLLHLGRQVPARRPRPSSPDVAWTTPSTPPPRPPQAWLAFLDAALWPDDPQSVETLQEWFGYCLTPDTRQQKMLLRVGPKRSGKGTVARVLKGLVGADNVAGPTLSQPGDQLRAVAAAGQDGGRRLGRPADRAGRRPGRHHRAAAVDRGRGHADGGPQAPAAGPRQAADAVHDPDATSCRG